MKTIKVIVLLLVVALNVPANIAREPVRARHGMVASTNEVASQVGVDIMKRAGVLKTGTPEELESLAGRLPVFRVDPVA